MLALLCVASNDAHPLDDLEAQFLSTISAWVGTIIENVRLNLQQHHLVHAERMAPRHVSSNSLHHRSRSNMPTC